MLLNPPDRRLFFGAVSCRRLGLILGTGFLRIAGPLFPPRFIIMAGHSDRGEKIEDLIFVHEVKALGAQTYKVGAILSVVAAQALIHAKQVRVRAVGAFSQGNAYLGNNNPAGAADDKEVFTYNIVIAVRQCGIAFHKSQEPATAEQVRTSPGIGLDLIEAFVYPMNAVSTVNQLRPADRGLLPAHLVLIACFDRAIPRAPGGISLVMQLPAAT